MFVRTPDIECIWLKLVLKRARPTYVCAFYRPPDGNVESGLNLLEQDYRGYIDRPDANLLCLGDMSINYLEPSSAKSKLDRMLRLLNCYQVIQSPTRVTIQTKTLLDHVYCNNRNLYSHWGKIDLGLSDHQMVYVC